ncbi:MAG: PQQ-binding-like beta-propeller repeat protein [Chryseosolibacter sp.]
MKAKTFLIILVVIVTLLAVLYFNRVSHSGQEEWRDYLGGPERNHYSTLTQIDLSNATQLQKAWEYHSGDSGQVQCNPLIVDGKLYAVTANAEPFALDAATGKEIWRIRNTSKNNVIMRGVSYWEDGDDQRILYTREHWLCAADALTGEPVMTFGDSGRVSLKTGLGANAEKKYVVSRTPGTVFEDLIIMPLSLSEGSDAAPGNIQAFNIRTGKLEWVFKTIPEPGEFGYDTWPADAYKNTNVGAANNWAGMAVDYKRGIIYAPTGSAGFDFYGGPRKGANLFANTLLALNARTGERIWHFQFVHHDIFDRDAPAPPNLITLTQNGKKVDAVAQVTKQGFVYVFNRETGEPLFPIEEVATPPSDVPGEEAWPTQPLPSRPLPYARQTITEGDLNPYSSNKDSVVISFKQSRFEGPYTPLSKRGSIIYPGLDGGAEWGGAAVDPEGIMYLNSNEMGWLISLNERQASAENIVSPGQQVYAQHCSSCHGAERKGNAGSGYPSLVNVNDRFERNHVLDVITKGKGRMPGNARLSENEKKMLVAFLYGERMPDNLATRVDKKEVMGEEPIDYKISGYTKFLDKDGYPAIRPPWGTLNAINLNTGEYVWTKVFGTYPELEAKGIPQTGSESYGGPVITASGLLFIAGTKDRKFRVYNKANGELVWETLLPAAGFATPSTYQVNGKQYIVVACGGTKLGAEKGDSYVAFALPE